MHHLLPYEIRFSKKKNFHIGLYGGTFDPVHTGHIGVAHTALKKLKCDRILWMVTPQNPDKKRTPTAAHIRKSRLKDTLNHPDFIVTDFEGDYGFRYTYDTVSFLTRHYPHITFTFIMGADSLRHFHDWKYWRKITNLCHICIVARPGSGYNSRFIKAFTMPGKKEKTFLNHPMQDISSTEIRASL